MLVRCSDDLTAALMAVRAVLEPRGALTVVCWESIAEDSAARAFAVGFYASIADRLREHTRAQVRAARLAQRPVASLVRRWLVSDGGAEGGGGGGGSAAGAESGSGDVNDGDVRTVHADALAAFEAGVCSFLSAGFRFGDRIAVTSATALSTPAQDEYPACP